MAGNSKERGQSVAGRLLRILDAFGPQSPELSLVELGRRTGLPVATLHRLLGELVSHGAIERTGAGRYAVGLRLWEIGNASPRASRLDAAAVPYLQDLHEATRGSTYLAVHLGGSALCVVAIVGHHPVQPVVRAGTRAPLMSPGAGEVLLAHAGPDVIEQALANCVPGPDHNGHRARQRLADIRRSGIAVAHNGNSSVVVVAPVYGRPGEVVAALSVAVRPIDTLRAPPGLVRLAAARVSHELGRPEPIFRPVRPRVVLAARIDDSRIRPGCRPA